MAWRANLDWQTRRPAFAVPRAPDRSGPSRRQRTCSRHGADLSRTGFTIAQVVHDYGDLCQTITELALEQKDQISTEDFKILNKSLDDAIAGAVTEFSRLREASRDRAETERLGNRCRSTAHRRVADESPE